MIHSPASRPALSPHRATRSHRRRSRAQGMVEYALIITLIAVAVLLSLSFVGHNVSSAMCRVSNGLAGTPTAGNGWSNTGGPSTLSYSSGGIAFTAAPSSPAVATGAYTGSDATTQSCYNVWKASAPSGDQVQLTYTVPAGTYLCFGFELTNQPTPQTSTWCYASGGSALIGGGNQVDYTLVVYTSSVDTTGGANNSGYAQNVVQYLGSVSYYWNS